VTDYMRPGFMAATGSLFVVKQTKQNF